MYKIKQLIKKLRGLLLKRKYLHLVFKGKISFKYLYNHPTVLTIITLDQKGKESWYMIGDGLDIVNEQLHSIPDGTLIPYAVHMDVFDIHPNRVAIYLYNNNKK